MPTFLFVPGLRDESPTHWQSLLAARLPGARSVPALGRDDLRSGARVAALDEALRDIEGAVVLVAHSGGCITVAQWAATPGRREVAGAFLAVPADMERPMPAGYPPTMALSANGWLPLPRAALPFRSVVGVSGNDPLGEAPRIRALARDWGSECVELGAVGHLNPAAGYGEWPEGALLLHRWFGAPAGAAGQP